jgi:hypothetical protein
MSGKMVGRYRASAGWFSGPVSQGPYTVLIEGQPAAHTWVSLVAPDGAQRVYVVAQALTDGNGQVTFTGRSQYPLEDATLAYTVQIGNRETLNPMPPPVDQVVTTSTNASDYDGTGHYGPYLTTLLGQPVASRVRLFDQTTGRLVRQVWTLPDGVYLFDRLNPDPNLTWQIVADDLTQQHESVTASWKKTQT